jgi:hypothetical protein
MMAKQRVWVRLRTLSNQEKAAVSAACDRFIAEVLKPRFLPEIRPTPFNYPIDINGKWRGNKYSFLQRYGTGFAENLGEEFSTAFTRLDHVEECVREVRFNLMWHRHTGQWLCLHRAVTLDEALQLIETEPLLRPIS